MAASTDVDLLRGTLDLLILRSLTWGPRHGYGIAEWIDDVTRSEVLLEEGTLYPALHRLERRKWVESEWGLSSKNRKAKYYQLTTRGRRALTAEISTWERYVAAVGRAIVATPQRA
jgi:PadR family transcriptional regulator, regulatory protein PadR